MNIPIKKFREWGRQGGLKGGAARARSLSPERRREIAVIASQAAAKARRKRAKEK
jgi:hypothetical protein